MPPVTSVLKEITLINAAETFTQTHTRARRWEVRVRTNFVEFVVIRIFSTKLGQLCGVLLGAARSHRFSDLKELHSSKPDIGNEGLDGHRS